jgi:hypothetical protein
MGNERTIVGLTMHYGSPWRDSADAASCYPRRMSQALKSYLIFLAASTHAVGRILLLVISEMHMRRALATLRREGQQ